MGFFLESKGERTTQLIIRSSGGAVGMAIFDLAHFVMEQKMMRGLNTRAEAHAGGTPRARLMQSAWLDRA